MVIHEKDLTKKEVDEIYSNGSYCGLNIFRYKGNDYFIDLDKRFNDLWGDAGLPGEPTDE